MNMWMRVLYIYENMMLMMIWTDVSLILIIAGEICGIDVKRQNPTKYRCGHSRVETVHFN